METYEMMMRRRAKEAAKRAKIEKIESALVKILGFGCGVLCGKVFLQMLKI